MPGFHLGGDYAIGVLFVGCVLFIGVAALSRQNDRPYSASVFYLLLGVVASVAMGVLGVGRLDVVGDHVVFEHVTELALVIAVFGAGLAVERNVGRRSRRVIALLLLVVMPLTIAAIAAFGVVAMGLPFAGALLLGAILAPTDPVLAGDVGLGPPGGQDQGEPRLSLHTEAGINDGLGSPFVLIGLFVATRSGTGWIGAWVLSDVFYAVGVAVVIGAAGGWLIAAAIARLQARDVIARDLDGFFAPATALVIYGIAQALGSYGLLAVFTAGIAFRRHEFDHEINTRIHHCAETAGRLLELTVLLLLGSTITIAGLELPGVAGWLLVPLLILIIRPILVLMVTGRRFLDLRGRLFLGFFGVRGVAAIYYATIVAETGDLSRAATTTVVWTTIVCVAVSITIHGITATPLTRWLID
ncbi:MAG: cation:proton antiporter [Solirubrobacteraceae bacterium]